MKMIYCPACGHRVSARASACPNCGDPIRNQSGQTGPPPMILHSPTDYWSPGIAAVLSFFIPGLGQIYKGQIFNGIAWLISVPIGYFFFVVPGLILHLFCIIGATMGDPTQRKG